MKTDYGKLGQESMDSLKATSKQAAAVQACLLSEIIRRNRDTVCMGIMKITFCR